jgi:hypothetical protein
MAGMLKSKIEFLHNAKEPWQLYFFVLSQSQGKQKVFQFCFGEVSTCQVSQKKTIKIL